MKHRATMQIALAFALVLGLTGSAQAADKLKAVASFSILGDMVQKVGGDRVELITLVGPDGDAHVYEPTPADARNLAASQDPVRQRPRLRRLDGSVGKVVRLQRQGR